MKYLITGGAGFIGSHLADALIARGDAVTIIDDLSTGSIENLAGLRRQPDFAYHIGSMCDERILAELVDGADAIYHLAAAVGVKVIVESPIHTIKTNVGCTELLLELATKKRKKVLITSTSEVYGKSKELPFRENADLVLGATSRGRWSYACSKALDEFLAIAYWREKRLPTVIARLFNTVGPRQSGRYGMVLPRFVTQALSGKPLSVHGDGRQSRCFTHVKDAVQGLIGLMDADATVGEIYNIGSTEEVTILELAQRVLKRTESPSEIIFVPYDVAYEENFEDMTRRLPDINKIKRLIGWAPAHSLDQVVDSVIEYQHALTDPRATRPRMVSSSLPVSSSSVTVSSSSVTVPPSSVTVPPSGVAVPRSGVTGRWGVFLKDIERVGVEDIEPVDLEDIEPVGNYDGAVRLSRVRRLAIGDRALTLVPTGRELEAYVESQQGEDVAAQDSVIDYERGRGGQRIERRRVARSA